MMIVNHPMFVDFTPLDARLFHDFSGPNTMAKIPYEIAPNLDETLRELEEVYKGFPWSTSGISILRFYYVVLRYGTPETPHRIAYHLKREYS